MKSAALSILFSVLAGLSYPTGAHADEPVDPVESADGLESVTTHYPDGSKLAVGTKLGGKWHGPYVEYFRNGIKRIWGTYRYGRKYGLWKMNTVHGQLLFETVYVNSKKYGAHRQRCTTDGSKATYWEVSYYVRGLLHGPSTRWACSAGHVVSEGANLYGSREGAWRYYRDDQNQLRSATTYHCGQPTRFHWFREDGSVRREQDAKPSAVMIERCKQDRARLSARPTLTRAWVADNCVRTGCLLEHDGFSCRIPKPPNAQAGQMPPLPKECKPVPDGAECPNDPLLTPELREAVKKQLEQLGSGQTRKSRKFRIRCKAATFGGRG